MLFDIPSSKLKPRHPSKILTSLCAYQGGKSRISKDLVKAIISQCDFNSDTKLYDVCCGSGAVSLEFMNQTSMRPSNITMVDASSWGALWLAIGSGSFDMGLFESNLSKVPDDQRLIKDYLDSISGNPVDDTYEVHMYPIFQAASFGGKQIWRNGSRWKNAVFRPFWEPKPDCVRQSHVNTMQPGKPELLHRMKKIVEACKDIHVIHGDASSILDLDVGSNSIIYIDPPYESTTGYGFELDTRLLLSEICDRFDCPVFVSEAIPLSDDFVELHMQGAKGGVSGNRKEKHREYLSRIK